MSKQNAVIPKKINDNATQRGKLPWPYGSLGIGIQSVLTVAGDLAGTLASVGWARQVPALLPRLQLAFLPLWLVGIEAALIFALVTVATVTLFPLLYHPVSTDRLARF